jgi:hypothetical protein
MEISKKIIEILIENLFGNKLFFVFILQILDKNFLR